MTTLTYPNVSQAQIDKLKTALVKGGASVTANPDGSFGIQGSGITSRAVVIGSTLTVEIVQKPFFVPALMIDGHIKEALAA